MDILRIPGYLANADGTAGAPRHVHVGFSNSAMLVAQAPVNDVNGALASVTTAAANTALVLKAAPGNLYGANCTPSAAGYLMLFDAAAAPADGAVTPRRVWSIPAGGTLEVGFPTPLRMAAGAVLVFSSTGPFLKTTNSGSNAFMTGEVL
jgi:hypothetical protein